MVLKVGLIGLGAMGSNHARIIHESPRADLHMVFDANKGVCERMATSLNSIPASSLEQMEVCDAVVVATSTASHVAIGSHFLDKGKALLVEKPLCGTLEETREVIRRSDNQGTVLTCGFVEIQSCTYNCLETRGRTSASSVVLSPLSVQPTGVIRCCNGPSHP